VPQSLDRYVYTVNNPLRYVDPTGEDFWSAVGAALNAVGQALSKINPLDLLDAVMMVVGFIPGLDIISDAYSLMRSVIDVALGKATWADVAMAAAFLLLPGVGGAAVMKLMKKAANVADGVADGARTANKAGDLAKGAKGAAKADNVGDQKLIRYMTNDEYKHVQKTNDLKFGKPKVYATTERVTSNIELGARGGIVEPKQWGMKFSVGSGHFQPNGLAKYPNGHPLAGREIPGGIPEFFSAGPVRIKQIIEVWPIS